MKPSEIADALDRESIKDGDIWSSAAAKIRDSEELLDLAEKLCEAAVSRYERTAANLKIATEVLEKQKEELLYYRDIIDCDDWIDNLTQALACIKATHELV